MLLIQSNFKQFSLPISVSFLSIAVFPWFFSPIAILSLFCLISQILRATYISEFPVWAPPRGKRDGVIEHISRRESGNGMGKLALMREKSMWHPPWLSKLGMNANLRHLGAWFVRKTCEKQLMTCTYLSAYIHLFNNLLQTQEQVPYINEIWISVAYCHLVFRFVDNIFPDIHFADDIFSDCCFSDDDFSRFPLAIKGAPKRKEHGNRLIFSMEFGKMAHILAGIGNRNTSGHGFFYFDRYLTDFFK